MAKGRGAKGGDTNNTSGAAPDADPKDKNEDPEVVPPPPEGIVACWKLGGAGARGNGSGR